MIEHEIKRLSWTDDLVYLSAKCRWRLEKAGKKEAKTLFESLYCNASVDELVSARQEVKDFLFSTSDPVDRVFANSLARRLSYRIKKYSAETRIDYPAAEKLQAVLPAENRRMRDSIEQKAARTGFNLMHLGESFRSSLYEMKRVINKRVVGIAALALLAFLGYAGLRHQAPPQVAAQPETSLIIPPPATAPPLSGERLVETNALTVPVPAELPEAGASAETLAEMKDKMTVNAGDKMLLSGRVMNGIPYELSAVAPTREGKFMVNELVVSGYSLPNPDGLTVWTLHSGKVNLDGQKIILPGDLITQNAQETTDYIDVNSGNKNCRLYYICRFSVPNAASWIDESYIKDQVANHGFDLKNGKYVALITCGGWNEESQVYEDSTLLIFKQVPEAFPVQTVTSEHPAVVSWINAWWQSIKLSISK